MTEQELTEYLRKKLLRWHYNKTRTISIVDLLESGYQGFRRRVARRLEQDPESYNFRDAIKFANLEELRYLQGRIDEDRLGL